MVFKKFKERRIGKKKVKRILKSRKKAQRASIRLEKAIKGRINVQKGKLPWWF